MAMDLDQWVRISLESRMLYIPQVLANFREYPGTKTTSEANPFLHDRCAIVAKTFSNPRLPKEIRSRKRRIYGSMHLGSGITSHTAGQMQEARRHLMKALVLHPQHFLKDPSLFGYLITSHLRVKATKIIVRWKRRLFQ
jgi:hypothetical protein